MAKIVIAGQEFEKLANAAHFNAKELARLCRRSSRQLQRDFRRCFGCTPQAWLNGRKMEAAQRQLLAGEPVKKVALDLRFRHVSHFCVWFKSAMRMTPTEFVSLHNGAATEVAKT